MFSPFQINRLIKEWNTILQRNRIITFFKTNNVWSRHNVKECNENNVSPWIAKYIAKIRYAKVRGASSQVPESSSQLHMFTTAVYLSADTQLVQSDDNHRIHSSWYTQRNTTQLGSKTTVVALQMTLTWAFIWSWHLDWHFAKDRTPLYPTIASSTAHPRKSSPLAPPILRAAPHRTPGAPAGLSGSRKRLSRTAGKRKYSGKANIISTEDCQSATVSVALFIGKFICLYS